MFFIETTVVRTELNQLFVRELGMFHFVRVLDYTLTGISARTILFSLLQLSATFFGSFLPQLCPELNYIGLSGRKNIHAGVMYKE